MKNRKPFAELTRPFGAERREAIELRKRQLLEELTETLIAS